VRLRKAGERQDVRAGVLQHLRRGPEPLGKLLDHPRVLHVRRGCIGLGEDRAHERRDERSSRLRHAGEQVAKEMVPVPLPASAGKRRDDRVDQAGMGVGDHQAHPGEPARDRPGRNAVQPAPSSEVCRSRPKISRLPAAFTPVATTQATAAIRPRGPSG
jgi:hypothetical protein